MHEAFAYHSQRYGTRWLRVEGQADGHRVGRWRIRRVLHAHGLRAQPPRSFVPRTTDSDPAVRAAPNRLLGLVVHSDQDSQYTATRFKELVAKHGAQQSTSRQGSCYDNSHAESFWSRFKAELLDGGGFPNLAEAKLEISHHIAYYNAERRHSALGYHSPNHFEAHLQITSQLCPAQPDHLSWSSRRFWRATASWC